MWEQSVGHVRGLFWPFLGSLPVKLTSITATTNKISSLFNLVAYSRLRFNDLIDECNRHPTPSGSHQPSARHPPAIDDSYSSRSISRTACPVNMRCSLAAEPGAELTRRRDSSTKITNMRIQIHQPLPDAKELTPLAGIAASRPPSRPPRLGRRGHFRRPNPLAKPSPSPPTPALTPSRRALEQIVS
ncbi:hypothetical protein SODALDRAFT_374742 [Sodiomyces alkalinus F11]|uniref:Uncharacterized protein n=1 Tax=Sodiomyces alkalinus (strain CBS 110278 / VKM F-3762 / F11) TaxID=1314773 RepID=A0A3N2Q6I6_SODAK|nr:hypothetical protein SODALDRAFT_374742 [Sodiomyces alkalinus F11]ROT42403.1 hypothetical protein SODALDRAFT_374742 [Sodiomyces alkalinus F11]